MVWKALAILVRDFETCQADADQGLGDLGADTGEDDLAAEQAGGVSGL